MRTIKQIRSFATEDILNLIRDNDLTDLNTFLVLNGGTGVGKTVAVMTQVKNELEKKFECPQKMLVVESRTATTIQLRVAYTDKIETFGGIDVCQRIRFMRLIEEGLKHYDWIVIDECHGLFSEASFAEDAEFIADWIKTKRENTHIIFITANDEYFNALSTKYFPNDYNFIYLFPDFTRYISYTYVKQIQFIKTNKTESAIDFMRQKLIGKKGIIFLKKASDVKDWFFKLMAEGVRVGLVVSQANETECSLTKPQRQAAQNFAIDVSNGRAGFTMADFCDMFDAMRVANEKESLRQALADQRIPEDIDVLLATDTIQEGISIQSHIDYIFIEGFTEVEVRQKLGRFRGNLNLLYIIFNSSAATSYYSKNLEIFEKLRSLSQVERAEFYGAQIASKSSISFLVKKENFNGGEPQYEINLPALLDLEYEFQRCKELIHSPQTAIQEFYSYPLLEGKVDVLEYEEIRKENNENTIYAIAKEFAGKPLKGKIQEDFVKKFADCNLRDESGRKIQTFTKACNAVRKIGIEIKDKQANQKDLKEWSGILSKIREKYKVIVIDENA